MIWKYSVKYNSFLIKKISGKTTTILTWVRFEGIFPLKLSTGCARGTPASWDDSSGCRPEVLQARTERLYPRHHCWTSWELHSLFSFWLHFELVYSSLRSVHGFIWLCRIDFWLKLLFNPFFYLNSLLILVSRHLYISLCTQINSS